MSSGWGSPGPGTWSEEEEPESGSVADSKSFQEVVKVDPDDVEVGVDVDGVVDKSVICLNCGSRFQVQQRGSVIKREVEEDAGDPDVEVEGSVPTTDPGEESTSTMEDKELEASSSWRWSPEEIRLFQWYSKWLGVELTGILWNFEKEPFPFCFLCRNQLSFLLDIRRRIDELEGELKRGVGELRGKVISSEGEVESSGVYRKDGRYFRVRRQVHEAGTGDKEGRKLEPEITGNSRTCPNPAVSNLEHSRTSKRVRKPVERYNPEPGKSLDSAPFVSISAEDKAQADQAQFKTSEMKLEGKGTALLEEAIPKRRRGRPKKQKPDPVPDRKTKRQKNDEDFMLSEDMEANTDEDDDAAISEFEEPDDNFSRKGASGKLKKYHKLKKDLSTGELIFKNVRFQHVQDDDYTCKKCDELVPNKGTRIKAHVNRAHTNRYVCSTCGHRASAKGHLERHINSTHKGFRFTRYDCNICGRHLYRKHELDRHRWTHYSEEEKKEAIAKGQKEPAPYQRVRAKKYQCDDCGRAFACGVEFSNHKFAVHGSQEEKQKAKILCPICGKAVLPFRMKNHTNFFHPVAGRFNCFKCGKEFYNRKYLRDHLRTHEERPFQCTICGKGFVKNESFTGHMNIHNNIRPFACEFCPMRFASKVVLKKHCKIFHEEGSAPKRKPYIRGCRIPDEGSAVQASSQNNII